MTEQLKRRRGRPRGTTPDLRATCHAVAVRMIEKGYENPVHALRELRVEKRVVLRAYNSPKNQEDVIRRQFRKSGREYLEKARAEVPALVPSSKPVYAREAQLYLHLMATADRCRDRIRAAETARERVLTMIEHVEKHRRIIEAMTRPLSDLQYLSGFNRYLK